MCHLDIERYENCIALQGNFTCVYRSICSMVLRRYTNIYRCHTHITNDENEITCNRNKKKYGKIQKTVSIRLILIGENVTVAIYGTQTHICTDINTVKFTFCTIPYFTDSPVSGRQEEVLFYFLIYIVRLRKRTHSIHCRIPCKFHRELFEFLIVNKWKMWSPIDECG